MAFRSPYNRAPAPVVVVAPPPPPLLIKDGLVFDAATPSEGAVVLVIASPAELKQKEFKGERAGKAYHAAQRRVAGLVDPAPADLSRPGSAASAADDGEDKAMREAYKQRRKAEGYDSDDDDDDLNYYELLGIGHLGLNASDKQIKKAYTTTVLRVHPDKAANGTEEEKTAMNEAFRKVQKAYDVLFNPVTRRGYDSQFDFDDTIPTGKEDFMIDEDFIRLYAPVFERNARFSVVKPVPMLGGIDDDKAKVTAFYSFWRGFKSWREFSSFDEFKPNDIETAEDRDERRWMQRKNEAAREKRRKAEVARVASLVERAAKNDPRIAKFKAEVEKAKEEAKQAKEEAKRKEEEAKAEAIRLEEEKIAEAKRAQESIKAGKAAEKNKWKAAAKRFRELIGQAAGADSEKHQIDLGLLVSSMDGSVERMNALSEQMEALGSPAERIAAFLEHVKVLQGGGAPNAPTTAPAVATTPVVAAAPAKEEPKKPKFQWTRESLSCLAKGMSKYPGGTRERWQSISAYLAQNGYVVTPDECVHAAQSSAATVAPPNNVNA